MTAGTAGKALRTLVSLGVLEISGKKGKAYIYKRKEVSPCFTNTNFT